MNVRETTLVTASTRTGDAAHLAHRPILASSITSRVFVDANAAATTSSRPATSHSFPTPHSSHAQAIRNRPYDWRKIHRADTV
ncbi:hypothetical protein GFS60_06457 (plasmid) [Rhodococcus sp. WAY2]|nr:hypothetical protein GFS60_06457 [Rhodococcus sp. WAY2]